MIENYLLDELVTFAQYKTLAATAQHLSVTQPTVTRGMQKLEDEFGVKIFNRQPNRITLTETGKVAATEAKKVLDQNRQMLQTVQKFEHSHSLLEVAAIAPGPMIVLNHLNLAKNIQLTKDFLDPNSVVEHLQKHDFSLIVTNQEIITSDIESRFVGMEKLSVNLDKFTYLANQAKIHFKDLQGISFIVLTDIGIWKQVIQQEIPNAKFLYQDQVDAFTEITKYSNFPYFSTNLSKINPNHISQDEDNRVRISIQDDRAKMNFYASYLKEKKAVVTPLINQLADAWVK